MLKFTPTHIPSLVILYIILPAYAPQSTTQITQLHTTYLTYMSRKYFSRGLGTWPFTAKLWKQNICLWKQLKQVNITKPQIFGMCWINRLYLMALCACVHRRSQGGQKGPCPPKFLENIVILCFERRFSRQNSVICLKSNILPPPQIFGLTTPLHAW